MSSRRWNPTRRVFFALDVLRFGAVALVMLPIGLAICWTAAAVMPSKGRA